MAGNRFDSRAKDSQRCSAPNCEGNFLSSAELIGTSSGVVPAMKPEAGVSKCSTVDRSYSCDLAKPRKCVAGGCREVPPHGKLIDRMHEHGRTLH